MGVTETSPASLSSQYPLAVFNYIRNQNPASILLFAPNQSAQRHLNLQILSSLSHLILSPSVSPFLRPEVLSVSERSQSSYACIAHQANTSSIPPFAPIGSPERHKFLPTETYYTIASITALDINLNSVNQLSTLLLRLSYYALL